MLTLKKVLPILMIGIAVPQAARAATITVTNNGDTTADDGTCTLREAITSATSNAASGANLGECIAGNDTDDTIDFSPSLLGGTITLNNGINISDDIGLSIAGPGASQLTIDGNGTASSIFVFDDSVNFGAVPFNIAGVTITGGAGVWLSDDSSTLTLEDVIITQNITATIDGGGVRADCSNGSCNNPASVTIRNSVISDNSTTKAGGGLNGDFAAFIVESSVISGNSASQEGGAINLADSSLVLTDSTVTGNTSSLDGGAIEASNTLSVVTIDGSVFSGNTATGSGGAILVDLGSVTIKQSTLFDNEGLDGGAIRNQNGGTVTIENSTISGNRALRDGGGISNNDDNSTVVNLNQVTITLNTADFDANNSGNGGGISNEEQGNNDNTINLSNTIIAGNNDASAGNEAPDCNDPSDAGVSSIGNNLIGDIKGCTHHHFDTVAKNDQFGDSTGSGAINALLAPLNPADAGNPAQSIAPGFHALLTGSPAIDAIDSLIVAALADDQRGATRPQGAAADIGAIESGCGDNVVQVSEECDDGVSNSNSVADACRTDCTNAHCGDSVVDAGETCDDGNTTNGDGCSSTCADEVPGAVCGNNIVESGESCDDGNTTDGDGCDDSCLEEAAGTTGGDTGGTTGGDTAGDTSGDTGGDTSGDTTGDGGNSGGGCSLIR